VTEAKLVEAEGGLVPEGEGWFVLNAREAKWLDGHFGAYTRFEANPGDFPEVGINIGVLAPGQPACYYHGEGAQEGFLVLSGEALLLVEGEERRLRAWDYVHCPPWTEHVLVGAGDGPCAILAVGRRLDTGFVYPASEIAQRYGAGVDAETRDGKEAYGGLPQDQPVGYRHGWL
jgi:uncharacterized cupin superfamily protein